MYSMGRFYRLAQELACQITDRSCVPFEMQLLWRLDDLYQQRELLINVGAAYKEYYCFTDSDIRYTLVERLCSIESVDRAINLAIEDLKNKCGIIIFEEDDSPEEEFVNCENQLSLFDLPQPLKAA